MKLNVTRIAMTAGALAVMSCAPTLDTDRRAIARGTLGEEIYRVACQRIAREAYPTDVSGSQSRELCRGQAGPETAAPGRLRALAQQRDETVEALDLVLPASVEDDLEALMLNILPLYDPPAEVLPSLTAELGALLKRMDEDQAATDALGRMAARNGLRSTELQLGMVGPVLSYPDLPGLTRTAMAALSEGGVAAPAFEEVQRAVALELGTLVADDPSDLGTLDVTRQLLASTHPSFDGGLVGWYALRDERGLPLPRALGENGFVDGDSDGLADVNEDGRYVGSDGAELPLPTPFATALEATTDSAPRDAVGLASGDGGLPIYAARNADGTLLAAIMREARPWLEGENPVVEDMALSVPTQLGPQVDTTRDFGALNHPYTAFDTTAGPAFDLVHGVGSLLEQSETRDALALAQQLVANHESDIAALIDAGLFGDAVSDGFPDVALRQTNEFWDDMLRVLEGITRRPGMMEALLRAITDSRTERFGQVIAELARHRDRITLTGPNGGFSTPPLRGQEWTTEVNRAAPDNGANQSLLQQSVSIIHELDGAPFCNREGAHMIVSRLTVAGVTFDVPFGPFDLMDLPFPLGFLNLQPFPRCTLMNLPNAAEAAHLAILGELNLRPQVEAALPGFLVALTNIAGAIPGLSGLSLDGILEANSRIPGLTTRPTGEAMNRLLYGDWSQNRFLRELVEPPVTNEGIDVAQRHNGNVTISWERGFRFCGDQLLEGGQTCAGTVENVSFYQAFTPILEAFADFDPESTRTGEYLFGALASAIHTHYPTAANGMYQETNPNGARYVRFDGAVAYEPILQRLFGACAWEASSGRRVCRADSAAQLMKRLNRVLRTADAITIRPGVDGIDALAAFLEMTIDSRQHPTLVSRDGSRTTQTNRGTRTVNYTPTYLLLDGLSAVDDAWETAPEQHERWLRARSTVVDQLLTVTRAGTTFSMSNPRARGILSVVVDFLTQRIDDHVADADLQPWARGLSGRLENTLNGPLPASLMELLDAIANDPAARSSLFGLLSHLLSEDGGYLTTLVAAQDLMQVIDDDDNLQPLARLLATALAPAVRESIANGTLVQVEGSMANQSVELLRQVAALDPDNTLSAMLARTVTRRSATDPSTPLDTLLEVVAEVNRSAPNSGTSYRAADHNVLFNEVEDFLLDPERGLERLYSVLETRDGQ